MASATLPKKPVPRKDPRPRTHDGANTGVKLINRDPAMWYVGVAKGDAIEEYLNRGYDFVREEEGGVRFSVGKTSKNGEPIEYKGHVLMAISLEAKAYIDEYGEDGETGWAEASKLEEAIVDKRGAQRDLMRGLHGGYVRLQHEVQDLTTL